MSHKTKTKIGVLACCACGLSYLALTPVIGEMIAAFPDARESLVQMVITLPSFMFIVFSPIAGILQRRLPKKLLLMMSLGLYFTGGMFPFFFHGSVWCLLAGSVIIGCGSGMMMPVLNSIICDEFEDAERGLVMGLTSTSSAVGAMFFIFLSGQLTRLGWHYCYLCFLLVLPLALLVMLTIRSNSKRIEVTKKGIGFEMSPYIAFLFVLGFVYFSTQNAFNTNSAIYFAQLGLGGAELAGTATMFNTLGGILGGVLFGWIAGKVKNQVETVALTLAGVGFLAAYFLPSQLPILLGGALVGAGFSMYNAAGTLLLSRFLKPENNAFTVSVYIALVNLGGALSPFLVNTLSGFFAPGTATRFLFCGVTIVIGAAASLIVNRKRIAQAR